MENYSLQMECLENIEALINEHATAEMNILEASIEMFDKSIAIMEFTASAPNSIIIEGEILETVLDIVLFVPKVLVWIIVCAVDFVRNAFKRLLGIDNAYDHDSYFDDFDNKTETLKPDEIYGAATGSYTTDFDDDFVDIDLEQAVETIRDRIFSESDIAIKRGSYSPQTNGWTWFNLSDVEECIERITDTIEGLDLSEPTSVRNFNTEMEKLLGRFDQVVSETPSLDPRSCFDGVKDMSEFLKKIIESTKSKKAEIEATINSMKNDQSGIGLDHAKDLKIVCNNLKQYLNTLSTFLKDLTYACRTIRIQMKRILNYVKMKTLKHGG